MANMKTFDKKRVMEYIEIPRIEELCPNEQLYFIDKTFYIIYKANDITYPNVGKMVVGPYGKPMILVFNGIDIINDLETFVGLDIRKKKNVVNLVRELSMLSDIEENKIEKIFEKYINVLIPMCNLYKLCYLIPTMFHALDIRYYKGRQSCFGKALTVLSINQWLNGEIEKKEIFNVWPQILSSIDPSETVRNVSCIHVRGHDRELKSDRFINKKGHTISVRPHVKLVITTDKSDT